MLNIRTAIWRCACGLGAVLGLGTVLAAGAGEPPKEAELGNGAEAMFAKVGGTVITQREYAAAFAQAAKQKFYHGKPPEGEFAQLQREVGDALVNNVLLLDEAKRRGLQPDREAINKTIAGYEERYRASERWQQNRERLLPGLIQQLEKQSLLQRMSESVRGAVPAPTEEATRAYYDAHPDKFTEPEQVHLSVILLKVDPSSTKQVWDQAMAEGKALKKRLVGGARFEELARAQSGDPSAKDGGDMGYLHKGMLPDKVQEVVDKLQPGADSEPFRALEGVSILRLQDRKPARKKDFGEVRERARALLSQQQEEETWQSFIAGLRKAVPVEIDESNYLPLPTATGPSAQINPGAAH